MNVVGSREVAKLTGRNHKDLLRDIRGYIEVMEKSIERNFAPNEFFIESSYKDSIGRTLPCYLLTKKGCDMAADACRALDIANVGNALARLDDDEKGSIRLTDVTPNGGNPNVSIVNEPGLYSHDRCAEPSGRG